MRRLFVPLPGNEVLAARLAQRLGAEVGDVVLRHFPDGESYVRIESDVARRELVLVCTLDRPDAKILPLLLLAATASDLGAARIGLVAPYLAYLRQDRRFVAGEGVTSRYFASLLSRSVDWLVTVDPHLHRYASLSEIYPIPATAVRAAAVFVAWLRAHVRDPVLIGPDAESAQWVGAVAGAAGAPFVILEKVRHGDRDVDVSVPGIEEWRGRTPVLIDDIISTGRTMLAAIRELTRQRMSAAVVVAAHAVFADGAYDELLRARPAAVVTTNTIPHPSNAIDVTELVADALPGGG